MSFVSRGFQGRRNADADTGRIPPGQHATDDFPVLSAGPTPHTSLDMWTFSILVGAEGKTWTWKEFNELPTETVTVDIHCVTRWSKLDTVWQGVSLDTLLDQVEHDAAYVLAFCDGDYTTNLPLEDVTGNAHATRSRLLQLSPPADDRGHRPVRTRPGRRSSRSATRWPPSPPSRFAAGYRSTSSRTSPFAYASSIPSDARRRRGRVGSVPAGWSQASACSRSCPPLWSYRR